MELQVLRRNAASSVVPFVVTPSWSIDMITIRKSTATPWDVGDSFYEIECLGFMLPSQSFLQSKVSIQYWISR
jgi:hypothetical protein